MEPTLACHLKSSFKVQAALNSWWR